MNRQSHSMTLLIALVNGHNGGALVRAMREAGAPGCSKIAGCGFPILDDDPFATHDILFSLLYDAPEPVMEAARRLCAENRDIKTLVMLAEASKDCIETRLDAEESPEESTMKLIISIIEHGNAESVMGAAREAGATGGTIIKAQGTGTEEDVKFFGISLVPEKEMLFIVAPGQQAASILDAINRQPVFMEPGGGIYFTLNVQDMFIANVTNAFSDWTAQDA